MILYIFPRKTGKRTVRYWLFSGWTCFHNALSVIRERQTVFFHITVCLEPNRIPHAACHIVIFPSVTPNSGGQGFLTALSPWVWKHIDVFLWQLLQHLFTWLKDAYYVSTVSGFARGEDRKGMAFVLLLRFSSPWLLPPDLSTCKGGGWSKENVAMRRGREQQVWEVC